MMKTIMIIWIAQYWIHYKRNSRVKKMTKVVVQTIVLYLKGLPLAE